MRAVEKVVTVLKDGGEQGASVLLNFGNKNRKVESPWISCRVGIPFTDSHTRLLENESVE